jgi:phosphosulfolactate synthase (CoM biosynthesis protein A)
MHGKLPAGSVSASGVNPASVDADDVCTSTTGTGAATGAAAARAARSIAGAAADQSDPLSGTGPARDVVVERLSGLLRLNPRGTKPRERGLTEIRGPYYSAVGARYPADVLDTMGAYVDGLKFAGGSFCLMPEDRVREIVEVCHAHDVLVSTGGFLERALPLGPQTVERCLEACQSLGFDTIEISAGFVSVPPEDLLQLARRAMDLGFRVKPEVGVQFGAGGGAAVGELEAAREADEAIRMADRYLGLGLPLVMVESEGLTESVASARTDVIARLVSALGLDRLMFEAADPSVFRWYVKTYGPDVNLFVDHSQIVQLEALRSGLWGTTDVWGRIATFRPGS